MIKTGLMVKSGMKLVKVRANDNYEAGRQIGCLIKRETKKLLSQELKKDWEKCRKNSKERLEISREIFPEYVREAEGIAKGAEVDFDKFWLAMSCENALAIFEEKCTSIYRKNKDGYLVGHSEDWEPGWKKYLYFQDRTIRGVRVIEPCYVGTLGGTAASINSFGLLQTINSVEHIDEQSGIPKEIIGRWLSEAEDLDYIEKNFPKMKRAGGYVYSYYYKGEVMSLETSAKRFEMKRMKGDYWHANIYLGNLKAVEKKWEAGLEGSSKTRMKLVEDRIGKVQGVEDLKELLSIDPICDKYTLASIIFDTNLKKIYLAIDRPKINSKWETYEYP